MLHIFMILYHVVVVKQNRADNNIESVKSPWRLPKGEKISGLTTLAIPTK